MSCARVLIAIVCLIVAACGMAGELDSVDGLAATYPGLLDRHWAGNGADEIGETLVLHSAPYHHSGYFWGGWGLGLELRSDGVFEGHYSVGCSEESSSLVSAREHWRWDDGLIEVLGDRRRVVYQVLSFEADRLELRVLEYEQLQRH